MITASLNVRKLTSPPGRPPLYAMETPKGAPVELERDQVVQLLHLAEGLGGRFAQHWRTVLASIDAIEGR